LAWDWRPPVRRPFEEESPFEEEPNMALPLPPKSVIRCDPPTAQEVHDLLTSVIAGHPGAVETFTFYEEVDVWLGPWGDRGYPIAYGKFYNIAFTRNPHLRANPTTSEWVRRTGIRLQEAIRDYLVGRIRDGTLPALTEPELRRAAFDSHPRCYDQGGLALVVAAAPELIPLIATIPGAEFDPRSENFWPTVAQVFATLGRIAPQVTGIGLATLAGPAHTGVFPRAIQQDQRRFQNELALSRELGQIRASIEAGQVDHVPWLNEIIARLNAREFPDQGFARFARQVVEAAQLRKGMLQADYRTLLQQSPEVRSRVTAEFPDLLNGNP
jgi:hypothetical protein